jgi:diguanylate cyclase (GGDEF)-like protein
VAVLFIDLDGFKATNDDYGHAAGDAVLVEVAHRLTDTLRHRDALGRLGGDEFLVICPAITSLAAAQQLAARVHTALHGDMVVDAHSISIAATIGLAWTATAIPRDLLVSEADHAMYEQKREKQANRSTAA